jgi:excisionase family DNA binding protein
MRLGADLELAWSHPAATAATRRRILRALLHEIIVRVDEDHIAMVLHWEGGDHTSLKVKKNTAGKHRWTVAEDTVDLVRQLARHMPDNSIARLLNRVRKPTGRNNGWTDVRVRSFRHHYQIEVYRNGERAERGEICIEEAAAALNVCNTTVLRMIERGVLKAHQPCKGAPWAIKADDLNDEKVRAEARLRGLRPQPQNPAQQTLQFQ